MDATTLCYHLIGTWSLQTYISISNTDSTDITEPWGSSPQGFIMYSQDGYVSVHLQNPGQPAYKSSDIFGATDEEAAQSVRNYQGYCGPFKVEEQEGGRFLLHHTMELSFFPNWKGVTQNRLAKLDLGEDGKADTLTLSTDGPVPANGQQRIFKLVWKRAS